MRIAPVLILLLIAVGGCKRATPAIGESPPEKPVDASQLPMKYKDYNLVFVSFDALQASHVGSLGYSRNITPTIDAIARQSFTFTNTISVVSWTVPASMTWFTGVYPSEHRMTNKYAVYNRDVRKPANLKELAPTLVTLADLFRQHGYATAGFTGNAGVSGGFGYEQGFDVYVHETAKFGGFDYSIPCALEWLKANRQRKFFLFLHGYDCHGQNAPPGGYDYRFVNKDYDGKYLGTTLEQEALREEGLDRGFLTMRDQDVRFWRAIYDEKINRADERFKHFMAEFDTLGINDKTLFILTSDHGTEFYEHRRLDHGFTLYNEQLHVPLFIKFPGQSSQRIIADRCSSIDVMPTILGIMDLPVPTQLRGTSLVPAMKGEAIRKDVFSETDYRAYTYKRSIVSVDGWKLIYTLEARTRELYDLNTDPHETKNVAATERPRADELERKLFAHFASIGHDLSARRWEPGMNPVYASQGKDDAKK